MCCIHPRVSYRDSQPYIVSKKRHENGAHQQVNGIVIGHKYILRSITMSGTRVIYRYIIPGTTEYDGVPVDTVGQIRVNQGGKYHKNKHSSFEEKGQGVPCPALPPNYLQIIRNPCWPLHWVLLAIWLALCLFRILIRLVLICLVSPIFAFWGISLPSLSTSYVRIHFAS